MRPYYTAPEPQKENEHWKGPDTNERTAAFELAFIHNRITGVNPGLILPYLRHPNPTLVIDLNNTLMNQIRGIVQMSDGRLTYSDFSEWDIDNGPKLGMTREEYLVYAWKNKYAESISPAFSGASEAMCKFKRAGIRLVIATASNLSLSEIEWWLKWNSIPFDRIVKTTDKRGLGDLLIDDSPVTCEQFHREGLPVLRYEIDWNKHLTHIRGIKWN
jgi:hypothetical protein